MLYGWIDDPVPIDWPDELDFSYGEIVRIRDVEALADRNGIVLGYNLSGISVLRYNVMVSDEPVSWFLEKRFLESTGSISQHLPRRFRPVLGDETVIRLHDNSITRNLGIAGKLALTEGLWWTDDSDEPHGYTVRLPGERETYSLPFGVFDVVAGQTR